MTLPVDLKSLKGVTPTVAIIAMALGGYWFLQRDVRAEMAGQHEDLRQHIEATREGNARRDANDAEQLQLLRELRDINRETCIHSAKTAAEIHGCLYPGQSR